MQFVGQIEPQSAIKVMRTHGGMIVVAPPGAPVLAETVQETLGVVADWLGMRKPGRAEDGSPPLRFQWAGKEIHCPVGAHFDVMRTARGRSADQCAYLVTFHFGTPQSLSQGTAWNPLEVLEQANVWMGAFSMNIHMTMNALRAVEALDWEADDVFMVRARCTSVISADEDVPSRESPWTVDATVPSLKLGISDGPIADHLAVRLGSDLAGLFAARFYRGVLEIGQRLPDPEDFDDAS